jgi:hypothetical protein
MKQYLTDSVILAAIPAAGYWSAYLYERGYCSYFQIPATLIEVSLNSVLSSTLYLVGCLAVLMLVVDIIRRMMDGVSDTIKFTAYKLIFVYFLIGGMAVVSNISETTVRLALLLTAGPIVWMDIIWPLWTQRKTKGLANKVAAAKENYHKFDSILDIALKLIGSVPAVILAALYFVSLLSFFMGGFNAKTESEFLVSSAFEDRVLIRHYGASWIAMKYDVDTGTTQPDFLVVRDDNVKEISIRSVGHLIAKNVDDET